MSFDNINKEEYSSSSSDKLFNFDDELYMNWRNQLESDERKFKVRANYPIDSTVLDLISGNLIMTKNIKALTQLQANDNVVAASPGQQEIENQTTEEANIAILDSPTKKKRAQLRKNINKLLQKIISNHGKPNMEISSSPTYQKYNYNCSLYEYMDTRDNSNNSQLFQTCIDVM